MSELQSSVRQLRREIFSRKWPLDKEIRETAAKTPSHYFLANPSGLYLYVYLTRFVKALSENHFSRSFNDMAVLDWGCGKGHVSKLIRDLEPRHTESCDLLSDRDDSCFGQEVPLIERFRIQVNPLQHEYVLPYESDTFDIVLSVGVLEHVANERASLGEINRVLKPNGLFFCFFLPTRFSWTQQICRWLGDNYHDRLYTETKIKDLLAEVDMRLLDLWYRQLLPKNSVHYPYFRAFEHLDQLVTEHSALRYFATNVEFVSLKPSIGTNPLHIATAGKAKRSMESSNSGVNCLRCLDDWLRSSVA
jgi:SAM-dependent methyltransferase